MITSKPWSMTKWYVSTSSDSYPERRSSSHRRGMRSKPVSGSHWQTYQATRRIWHQRSKWASVPMPSSWYYHSWSAWDVGSPKEVLKHSQIAPEELATNQWATSRRRLARTRIKSHKDSKLRYRSFRLTKPHRLLHPSTIRILTEAALKLAVRVRIKSFREGSCLHHRIYSRRRSVRSIRRRPVQRMRLPRTVRFGPSWRLLGRTSGLTGGQFSTVWPEML